MPIIKILIGISIFCASAYATYICTQSISASVINTQKDAKLLGASAKWRIEPQFHRTFKDYPAQILTGAYASPHFKRSPDRYNQYRTAIALGTKAGPNFAGRFTVVEIGCGTSCTIPFIVDLRNGEIAELPSEIATIPDITFSYRLESTLFVALWPLDEFTSEPRCRRMYYTRSANNFVKVGETIVLGQCHP